MTSCLKFQDLYELESNNLERYEEKNSDNNHWASYVFEAFW